MWVGGLDIFFLAGLAATVIAIQKPRLDTSFGLAGKEGHPHVQNGLQFDGNLGQHGETTADVEATDGDRDIRIAKLPCNVRGPGELIRLYAHNADQSDGARLFDPPNYFLDRQDGIALVGGVDLDLDVLAQNLLLGGVTSKSVEASHRIGRDPGLGPLDDVSVVVVVGRLDKLDEELFGCAVFYIANRAVS
jgi:hypothetical protein